MGLFINKKQHPDVFKNKGALIEPNQVEYCINAFTEFVKEQKASNNSISKAIDKVHINQDKFHLHQNRKMSGMEDRIFELRNLHREHEKLEKQILSWLQRLENKQSNLLTLIQNEQRDKKELTAQLQTISNTQVEVLNELNELVKAKEGIQERLEIISSIKDEIMSQFQLVNSTNEQILNKIDEQTVHQHQVADKLTKLEDTQQEVLTRVDGQEGIIDKIIHQIDHVRFVLFERTNYLEEKMEKVYEQAVNYISKIKNNVIPTSTIDVSKGEVEEKKDV